MTQAIAIPQKTYEGLKGWLLVPLLGLMLGIFLEPFSIYETLLAFFDPEFIDYMRDFRANSADPDFIKNLIIIIYSALYPIFLLAFNVLLLWKFLTKSKTTPKLFILYLLLDVVLTVISIVTVVISPIILEDLSRQDYIDFAKELVGTLVRASIWIPYFLYSRRVKNTFVR